MLHVYMVSTQGFTRSLNNRIFSASPNCLFGHGYNVVEGSPSEKSLWLHRRVYRQWTNVLYGVGPNCGGHIKSHKHAFMCAREGAMCPRSLKMAVRMGVSAPLRLGWAAQDQLVPKLRSRVPSTCGFGSCSGSGFIYAKFVTSSNQFEFDASS